MNQEKNKVTQPEVGEIPQFKEEEEEEEEEEFRDGEHGFMDDHHQCNDDYGLSTRMDLQ